jgi:hypothetical protein
MTRYDDDRAGPSGAPLRLAPDDPRLTWHGVVSFEPGAGWRAPWRLPYADRGLYPPEVQPALAAMPYGGRLTLRSDTAVLAGRVVPVDLDGLAPPEYPLRDAVRRLMGSCLAEASAVDLCCDGALVGSASLAGRDGFRFDGLPPGPKDLELWLPQFAPFRLYDLELSPGATVAPAPDPDPRPRWIAYGSSLTGAYPPVAQPSRTWTAQVARARGLRHTVLAFAGGCHLEPMLARLIRDLPADYLSMEVALNALSAASLSPRTYASAVIGFVQTVRDGHPDIPVVVQSPIYVPHNDDPTSPRAQPNAVGFTLPAMREETAAAVARLRAHGDRFVHYVDGLRLYGPEQAHLSPDGVHPDAAGQDALAGAFLREVVAPYFT